MEGDGQYAIAVAIEGASSILNEIVRQLKRIADQLETVSRKYSNSNYIRTGDILPDDR
jgi:hypothetical protein